MPSKYTEEYFECAECDFKQIDLEPHKFVLGVGHLETPNIRQLRIVYLNKSILHLYYQ